MAGQMVHDGASSSILIVASTGYLISQIRRLAKTAYHLDTYFAIFHSISP